jgi:protein AATF/BFR2
VSCRFSSAIEFQFQPRRRPSALRKIHDSVADPKYDGRRATRKQLMESDEEDSQSDEDDDDDDDDLNQSEDENEDLPSQSEPERDVSESEQVEHASKSSPSRASEAPEDPSSTLRRNMDEDRRKGKAVSRQIVCGL